MNGIIKQNIVPDSHVDDTFLAEQKLKATITLTAQPTGTRPLSAKAISKFPDLIKKILNTSQPLLETISPIPKPQDFPEGQFSRSCEDTTQPTVTAKRAPVSLKDHIDTLQLHRNKVKTYLRRKDQLTQIANPLIGQYEQVDQAYTDWKSNIENKMSNGEIAKDDDAIITSLVAEGK